MGTVLLCELLRLAAGRVLIGRYFSLLSCLIAGWDDLFRLRDSGSLEPRTLYKIFA